MSQLIKIFPFLFLWCNLGNIHAQDYFIRIDSTDNDIEYFKYYTYLDTTPAALEYPISIDDTSFNIEFSFPIGIEPTFRDRYFSNIEIDTTATVHISKAITAREIVRSLLIDYYGLDRVYSAGKIIVALVDDKYWMVSCNINKGASDGSILIILSKYDGRIISWSNY